MTEMKAELIIQMISSIEYRHGGVLLFYKSRTMFIKIEPHNYCTAANWGIAAMQTMDITRFQEETSLIESCLFIRYELSILTTVND